MELQEQKFQQFSLQSINGYKHGNVIHCLFLLLLLSSQASGTKFHPAVTQT